MTRENFIESTGGRTMAEKLSPISSAHSEEFDLETRYVVLSFLGLVPSNILDQSFGSRGSGSDASGHSKNSSLGDSGHLSSLPKVSLSQKVDRLQDRDGEDYSFEMDNGFEGQDGLAEDTVDLPSSDVTQTLNDFLIKQKANEEIDKLKPKRKSNEIYERNQLAKQTSFDIKPDAGFIKRGSEDSSGKRRISKGHSMYMSPQRPTSIPVRSFLSVDSDHAAERVSPNRQFHRLESETSESSEITVSVQSSKSSYVDVQSLHLDHLVKNNMVNANLVPLREELEEERNELRTNFNLANRSTSVTSATTPQKDVSPEAIQAEVAQYLCILGDQVQEKYSGLLNSAFQSVITRPVEELTYTDLRAATEDMTGATTGWTKVALLLMLSKQLTFNVLSTGGKGVRKLSHLTAQLIEDTAASFILEKGGWHAITELELETPCTPSDVNMRFPMVTPDSNPATMTPELSAGGTTLEENDVEADDLNDSNDGRTPSAHGTPQEPPTYRDPLLSTSSDQPDAAISSDYVPTTAARTSSSQVEKEVRNNVESIRPDIPLWRQQSHEYSEYMEEEKQRLLEEEILWQKYKYMALGTLGLFALSMFAWRRFNSKS